MERFYFPAIRLVFSKNCNYENQVCVVNYVVVDEIQSFMIISNYDDDSQVLYDDMMDVE